MTEQEHARVQALLALIITLAYVGKLFFAADVPLPLGQAWGIILGYYFANARHSLPNRGK